MKALVVIAHPVEDSFCQAAAARAVTGLRKAGHHVDVIDLYDEKFRAAMSLEERIAYHTDEPVVDGQVADHVARLRRAEIVVFVYPTWWAGLPAILKGWFDRVLVPGVGFEFDERTGKVRPALTQIRHLVGVTSYGSQRWLIRLLADSGRRTIKRAFRLSCGIRTRTRWLGFYGMDDPEPDALREHLDRVERTMARLR